MATWFIGAAVWWAIARGLRSGRWWAFFASWPSTVLHELAHFVLALVTGSRPSRVSLWPHRMADGWRLGSVAFTVRPWWAAWVALAPAWWAFLAGWVFAPAHLASNWTAAVADGVLLGCILGAATPSRTDIELAIRHPAGLLTLLPIGLAAGALACERWS